MPTRPENQDQEGLGSRSRTIQDQAMHKEGHHTSVFPCTKMVAVVARRHSSRFATGLGRGCVSLPRQLFHPRLV